MTIHLEATIPAAPERVYELLTNGAKLGEATDMPGKGGGGEGAYFSLFGGWVSGRQIELAPNERITQAWRMTDWDPGVYSLVLFTLTPDRESTKLVVDQDAVPEAVHEHVRTNWGGCYFEPMTKHFAG